MVVIAYDVSTETPAGRKRLRKVAKICQNCGQRVQNSVFECVVDATEYAVLKRNLLNVINELEDSLRFYQLGKYYRSKIEHFGTKPSIDLEGPILL